MSRATIDACALSSCTLYTNHAERHTLQLIPSLVMSSSVLSSANVASALQSIDSSDSSNKSQSYSDLLAEILTSSTPDTLASNLIAYVRSLLGESLGIVASRPLLAQFVSHFGSVQNPAVKVEVGQRAIELLQPRVVSFEEQDAEIKYILAGAYEAQEDFISSARVLQSIPLDSSQRIVTDDVRAQTWIRIVRCYIEENDPVSATSYLNRLKNIIHNVKNNTTKLQFQLSQARILDSQNSFLDASAAYHSISFEPVIDEDERTMMLSSAIKCAVLAPAGPARARTLARLYKDDRASTLDEYGILEKIFLDRLLDPSEVKAFSEQLQPHQLARRSDGTTVLDKAVREHNLLGVSRLYNNIAFDSLGELLGVDGDAAEQYAAQMIEQGRMSGHIDQIDQIIFFEGEASGEHIKTGQSNGTSAGGELRKWDANIVGLAEEVERVTEMLQTQFPAFYEANMVH